MSNTATQLPYEWSPKHQVPIKSLKPNNWTIRRDLHNQRLFDASAAWQSSNPFVFLLVACLLAVNVHSIRPRPLIILQQFVGSGVKLKWIEWLTGLPKRRIVRVCTRPQACDNYSNVAVPHAWHVAPNSKQDSGQALQVSISVSGFARIIAAGV